jgi:hypothetical protein
VSVVMAGGAARRFIGAERNTEGAVSVKKCSPLTGQHSTESLAPTR